MTTLRWLHFTDLHIGQKDDWLWREVRGDLLDDLRRLTEALGPWDVVLFTGDLAFSGKQQEYEQLEQELDRIWHVFGSATANSCKPVLLAVPGNHDLARPARGSTLASALLNDDDAWREALWRGESANVADVRDYFSEYSEWWKACKYRPQTNITEGLLPGDYCYVHEKDGAKFGFIGMNSAFRDIADEIREGALWMDVRQIQPACDRDLKGWIDRQHSTFLMTHHPPQWINNKHLAAIAPAGRFNAHFCGHLHDSFNESRSVAGGPKQQLWQAPSLFGTLHKPNSDIDRKHGYTAGHLTLDESGAGHVDTWPRLGIKLQDKSWRITADFTQYVEQDILRLPREVWPSRGLPVVIPTPSRPVQQPASGWRDAVERWPLWTISASPDALEAARRLAADIVTICWRNRQNAGASVSDDPWSDDGFPVRVLARLENLVPAGQLSLEETVLLLTAPFIREGLFAAGARWMVDAKPSEMRVEGHKNEARKALETIHGARPGLVRRVDKLTGEARTSVWTWMVGRALQRSPLLWDRKPKVPETSQFTDQIKAVIGTVGAEHWLQLDRMILMARYVGVSPDVLEGEDGVERDGEIWPGGKRVRIAALAYLLCAAGWEALDLRAADDLVVDHIGRDNAFTPRALRDAIHTAEWMGTEDVHRLAQTCDHPVVDFLLRDLLDRAEAAIRRMTEARNKQPELYGTVLSRLPKQVAADLDARKGSDNRPVYRLPHVRFRLDHDQVRELLMGQQLYGDPMLAVRELYQNALDACRYRVAREEYLRQTGRRFGPKYEGRIMFREGVDNGRPFIECEDNGVGMTSGILEHVFSVAGKRFHDMPEFLEERTLWESVTPPVKFYPNSQFGIGVLSYFMLADEVTIRTRRLRPDGELGEPMAVHISSASGLFRLEPGQIDDMPCSGTQVRLYRSDRHSNLPHQMFSCAQALTQNLWVADFLTTLESAWVDAHRWMPGVLMPSGRAAVPNRFFPTTDPDVWCAPGTHQVLADGIPIPQSTTQNALVNLRGPRFPKLSTNRLQIMNWKDDWVHDILVASVPKLIDWEGLTVSFIHDLSTAKLSLGDVLRKALAYAHVRISIVASNDVKWTIFKECTLGLHEVGYVPGDRKWLSPFGEASPRDLFYAWRTDVWLRTGALPKATKWESRPHIRALPIFAAEPDDIAILIGRNRVSNEAETGPFQGRDHLVIDASDVLRATVVPQRSVREVIARVHAYEPLGFELDLDGVTELQLEELRLDDCSDFSEVISLRYPPTAIDAFRALLRHAHADDTRLLAIRAHLKSLGIQSSSVNNSLLKEVLQSTELLGVFQHVVTRSRGGVVPATRVLGYARGHKRPVSAVLADLRRFEPLGVRAPDVDPDRFEGLEEHDLRLLSQEFNESGPLIDNSASLALLAQMAMSLNVTPAEVSRRLTRLSWLGFELPRAATSTLDEIESGEPLSRHMMWHFTRAAATSSQIAEAAFQVHVRLQSAVDLASRLGILPAPLRAALDAVDLERRPSEHDVLILQAFERGPGRDSETRRRRGRATSRFFMWQTSDEELDAAIDRFSPIVNHIVNTSPSDPAA